VPNLSAIKFSPVITGASWWRMALPYRGVYPPNANDANSPSPPFPSFPFPSIPSLFPFPNTPFPLFLLPHFPPFPFPCRKAAPWNRQRGLGERFSSRSGVRGGAQAANAFWVKLEPRKRIWWQLLTIQSSIWPIYLGKLSPPLRAEFFPPLSQTGRKLRPLSPL